jgi:hypothetical protein
MSTQFFNVEDTIKRMETSFLKEIRESFIRDREEINQQIEESVESGSHSYEPYDKFIPIWWRKTSAPDLDYQRLMKLLNVSPIGEVAGIISRRKIEDGIIRQDSDIIIEEYKDSIILENEYCVYDFGKQNRHGAILHLKMFGEVKELVDGITDGFKCNIVRKIGDIYEPVNLFENEGIYSEGFGKNTWDPYRSESEKTRVEQWYNMSGIAPDTNTGSSIEIYLLTTHGRLFKKEIVNNPTACYSHESTLETGKWLLIEKIKPAFHSEFIIPVPRFNREYMRLIVETQFKYVPNLCIMFNKYHPQYNDLHKNQQILDEIITQRESLESEEHVFDHKILQHELSMKMERESIEKEKTSLRIKRDHLDKMEAKLRDKERKLSPNGKLVEELISIRDDAVQITEDLHSVVEDPNVLGDLFNEMTNVYDKIVVFIERLTKVIPEQTIEEGRHRELTNLVKDGFVTSMGLQMAATSSRTYVSD